VAALFNRLPLERFAGKPRGFNASDIRKGPAQLPGLVLNGQLRTLEHYRSPGG
jgi:hypothetical protein